MTKAIGGQKWNPKRTSWWPSSDLELTRFGAYSASSSQNPYIAGLERGRREEKSAWNIGKVGHTISCSAPHKLAQLW